MDISFYLGIGEKLVTRRVKILVFLQNAWRKGAKEGDTSWAPFFADEKKAKKLWYNALWACHTGKQLMKILPKGHNVLVENSSPIVGNKSWSNFGFSREHVLSKIEEHEPEIVVLLGNVARNAKEILEEKKIIYVTGPHPAARMLSNKRIQEIQDSILEAIKIVLSENIIAAKIEGETPSNGNNNGL